MKMKKALFIVLGCLVFLAVIGVIVSVFFKKEEAAQQESLPSNEMNALPIPKQSSVPSQSGAPLSSGGPMSSQPSAPPVSDQINIKDKDGDELTINNIYKEAINVQLPRNGVNFRDNADYYMAYYPEPLPGGFTIALKNPDVKKAREAAEKEFVELLGISREQACKLQVILAVPNDVNKEASGRDYNLSFCPDGIPLP